MSPENFTLLLGGDIFPSNRNISEFVNGDCDKLFDSQILALFQRANVSICNLEGVFTNEPEPIKKVDPTIYASKEAINGLTQLDVDYVTLANNHIMDCGRRGYDDTIRLLQEKGIGFFGVSDVMNHGSHYIMLNAHEKNICVYTVAETMFNTSAEGLPSVNLYDDYRICKELEDLKKQCDYLIVIYHGGAEFFWYNTELLRTRFHRMADAGADLITAQHTHCIGITEKYNNSYLLYGQGDFLFARSKNAYKEYGLLLEVTIFSNQEVIIKQHLIRHIDGRVVYDQKQDFSSYTDRNERYAGGDLFKKEYDQYSKEKMLKFLEAFRGRSIIDKIVKKICGEEKYRSYFIRKFTEEQLLRIISGLQFEEYNELLVNGLWNEIRKK